MLFRPYIYILITSLASANYLTSVTIQIADKLNMEKVSLNKEDIIKLMLQFLESAEYFQALIALERESNLKLRNYGKEIDFYYDLIMDGRFEDAENFIEPVESSNKTSYNSLMYSIRKQKFLEALESSANPELENLVIWLKDLEAIADRDDFNNLCYCLSLNKITDHPDYSDWSV